ncbi:MAG: glycosyltransferase family 2 protein [Planctomycetes bacterium]|nr:glycosyltransferase family 2 protein [Planctomycetota bacterium]MBI3846486.1 glycosyltransferase family 2 protein [Planctomycetota bacterium]
MSWNSAADLRGCIESLKRQEHAPFEIILVDNDSNDDGVSRVRAAWPEIVIRRLPRNTGFCRAMNLAIAMSTGEFVLTLNPDCRLDSKFLLHAMQSFRSDLGIGSVAPKLIRFDGNEPNGSEQTVDAAGLALTWIGRVVNRGEGDRAPKRFDRPAMVFGACGAAAVFRRAALDSVSSPDESPFDESFVAYKEDADLAWRLRRAGWNCAYQPRAIAFHRRRWRRGNRHDVPAAIRRRSLRNRWLLLAKHESLARFIVGLPFLVAAEAAVILRVLACERSLLGAYPEGARSVASALKKRRSRSSLAASHGPEAPAISNADSSGNGR